jgi:hypothetical protein
LKSTPANNPPKPDAVADIIAYHDRTKHHPERYANGPGGLDWANQPDPFRRFSGAPVLRLPLAGPDDTPPAAILFGAATVTSRPFTLEAVMSSIAATQVSALLHTSRMTNRWRWGKTSA